MTAITLTHLAAQEHINDLLRDAERSRRVVEIRRSRRFTLRSPRRFARRLIRPAALRRSPESSGLA